MIVTRLGEVTPDTILSGVIHLFMSGSWPIALIVFVASIFVPILKLIVFTYLVIAVQLKSQWRPKDRTKTVPVIGSDWSLVDGGYFRRIVNGCFGKGSGYSGNSRRPWRCSFWRGCDFNDLSGDDF